MNHVIAEPDPLLSAITTCRRLIGMRQMSVILSLLRGEEGEFYRAKLHELAQLFQTMPRTYSTDGAGDSAIVHLHYFRGSADWYVIERDTEESQRQAFGYADLFGDSGELGYIDLSDITRYGAEIDLHWSPRTLGEVIKERHRLTA